MNHKKDERKRHSAGSLPVSLMGLVDSIAADDLNSGGTEPSLSEKVEISDEKPPRKRRQHAAADNISDYDYLLRQASALKAKGWHKDGARTVSNAPIRDDIRVMLMKVKAKPEFRGYSMGDLLSAAWLLFIERHKDLDIFRDLIDDLNAIKSE